MKLYLVRHATATEHFNSKIRTDAERPLVDEGKDEAEVVAGAVKRLGAKPDLFLSSPLVRARQTAEIFAEVFNKKDSVHLTESLAPGGLASDLYKELAQYKKNEVFCFGHMPDISRLAATMLWAGTEFDMPFKKAAVCRIDLYDLPPTNPGTLKWFINPKIAASII